MTETKHKMCGVRTITFEWEGTKKRIVRIGREHPNNFDNEIAACVNDCKKRTREYFNKLSKSDKMFYVAFCAAFYGIFLRLLL